VLVIVLLFSLTSFAFCDMYAPGGILAQTVLDPTNDRAVPTSYGVATYLSGGIASALTVGLNGTGYDVKFYSENASYYWMYDDDADTNGGMVLVGTAKITGATTLIGALTVGVNDTGHDVKLFGATSGCYLLWDESDDRLEFVNSKIEIGTSGSPTPVLYNGTQVLQIYTTCASTTDTGFGQQIIKNVMTGAGQSTEGFQVELESNVKLGTYANAMCVRTDWQTNGGVTGLGSVICAEMIMGAAATNGTFGLLELELNCPASWTGTGAVSFLYMNTYGATKANFDNYGYFLNIDGVASGVDDFFYDNTVGVVDAFLKCKINGATYYLLLADDQS
jgi:hypothetical protein